MKWSFSLSCFFAVKLETTLREHFPKRCHRALQNSRWGSIRSMVVFQVPISNCGTWLTSTWEATDWLALSHLLVQLQEASECCGSLAMISLVLFRHPWEASQIFMFTTIENWVGNSLTLLGTPTLCESLYFFAFGFS